MELVLETEDRAYWNSKEYLDKSLRESVQSADILITPLENFREGVDISFYQGTLNLISYLGENLPSTLLLEICATDEDYAEIVLHSKQFRLGKILLTVAAVPIVINLLSNYVYDELKASNDDSVSISLAIEMENCKTYSVEYDGSAKDFDLLKDYVKEVLDKCEDNDKSH